MALNLFASTKRAFTLPVIAESFARAEKGVDLVRHAAHALDPGRDLLDLVAHRGVERLSRQHHDPVVRRHVDVRAVAVALGNAVRDTQLDSLVIHLGARRAPVDHGDDGGCAGADHRGRDAALERENAKRRGERQKEIPARHFVAPNS